MSFKSTLAFNNYEELCGYINNMEKCKKKQEKKKSNETIQDNSIDVLKSEAIDKRGMHQQRYHNLAKIYQDEHKALSYKDAIQ